MQVILKPFYSDHLDKAEAGERQWQVTVSLSHLDRAQSLVGDLVGTQ